MYTIGERINTVERLFNIEEGFTRADDVLPPRFAEEAAPSDPGAHTFDVTAVMDEYYAERGWDATGCRHRSCVERLGV